MSLLLVLLILVGIATPVTATKAAEDTADYVLYKGQKLHLWTQFGRRQLDKSEVKWSVKSGKKNVKILDDGLYIKGLKKGKAVITVDYKGDKTDFSVVVKKAPSAKKKTVKFGNNKFVIPKGYIVSEKTKDMVVCSSIKDDTEFIFSTEEYMAENYPDFPKNVYEYLEDIGCLYETVNFEMDGLFMYYEIVLSSPKFKYYCMSNQVEKEGCKYSYIATSFDSDSLKKLNEALSKYNSK